jgi:hypothetical protein
MNLQGIAQPPPPDPQYGHDPGGGQAPARRFSRLTPASLAALRASPAPGLPVLLHGRERLRTNAYRFRELLRSALPRAKESSALRTFALSSGASRSCESRARGPLGSRRHVFGSTRTAMGRLCRSRAHQRCVISKPISTPRLPGLASERERAREGERRLRTDSPGMNAGAPEDGGRQSPRGGLLRRRQGSPVARRIQVGCR